MFKRAVLFLVLFFLPAAVWGADPALYLPGAKDMKPLKQAGEPERFTPESLWEKINGEAELFRRFGLDEAVSIRFEDPADPAFHRVEVTIFAMKNPLGAFGIFASFRSPGVVAEEIGNGGFIQDHQAFFWSGRYFVLVDAQGPVDRRPLEIEAAVKGVTRRMGPPPKRGFLEVIEPVADITSVQYYPDHLLGRESLPPGIAGLTREGVPFLVASVPVEGEKVLNEYMKILKESKAVILEGYPGITGEDPEVGPVTLVIRDDLLAGVRLHAEEYGSKEILSLLLGDR
jgi:hypothetical protein